jgi:hypothetical protein
MNPRWRLVLAATAFLAWMAWLGYTALHKSHGPVVSHIQAAAAACAVVADVKDDVEGKPDSRVTVDEVISGKAPPPGIVMVVTNLHEAGGYKGTGKYLLYLTEPVVVPVRVGDKPEEPMPACAVVGQQRSPGNDLAGVGKPLIYQWNDDVRLQAEKLRPEKPEP